MKARWIMIFLVQVAAFAAGIIVGGGAVAFCWWTYATVVYEQSLDPLADLKIADASLSREQVDDHIRELGKRYHDQPAACVVVGVIHGEEERYFAFGKLPSGNEPDKDTVFELASVGKTFTGVLLADMVQRKEVALATTVESLLPQEAGISLIDGQSISLLDLATQSSGLTSVPANMPAANPLNPYADNTVALLYQDLQQTKLLFSPGRGYSYSNTGFGLLGHVLALKAGQDYEALIVDRLCTPLGMHDTRMTLTDAQKARIAIPHDGDRPVEVWEDITLAGAGSFLAPAKDVLHYLRAYWSHAEEPLRSALKMTVQKLRRTDTPSTAIGLGWHIHSENARDILWHNGGSGGSRSYVAMLPDRQIGVCVLANWAQANVDELGRKLIYLLALEHGDAPAVDSPL